MKDGPAKLIHYFSDPTHRCRQRYRRRHHSDGGFFGESGEPTILCGLELTMESRWVITAGTDRAPACAVLLDTSTGRRYRCGTDWHHGRRSLTDLFDLCQCRRKDAARHAGGSLFYPHSDVPDNACAGSRVLMEQVYWASRPDLILYSEVYPAEVLEAWLWAGWDGEDAEFTP